MNTATNKKTLTQNSSKEYIFTEIARIVSAHLCVESSSIVSDSNFSDLGADSLDIVEMVMSMEEAFGIPMRDLKALDIETVGQAVSFVQKRLAAKVVNETKKK